MPMLRSPSENLREDDGKENLQDSWQQVTGTGCITPPAGFKQTKHRTRHSSFHLPEWVLHELDRPTCPSETQRARDIFRRHEERRQMARQMLKSSPVPSPPSPRSIIKSRIQDEFDYSSDFTEEDEEGVPWVRSTSRHLDTNETSSGGEEILTSSDEELQLLMTNCKKDRRVRRSCTRTPAVCESVQQNHGDWGRKGKKYKAFDRKARENLSETDGRRFDLPYDRPLDPWKLPPIENLTKKGPVNLVLNPSTNPGLNNEELLTRSTSEQWLLKSLQTNARKLKKLERRQKRRKHDNK